MDSRVPADQPTVDEADALDRVLGPADRVDRPARSTLLAALHALVDRVGYVSRGGLAEISRRLDIAPAEVYGVASFYSMFPLEPVPARTVHVCEDLLCRMTGEVDHLVADAAASGARVERVACLGQCDRAPARLVTEAGRHPSSTVFVHHRSSQSIESTPPGRSLLRRVGVVHPRSLTEYEHLGGYVALRRALALGPARIIEAVTASGLTGRGGAGFPTGRKWAAVAAQPAGTRYVIANADESEPGTFKDRVLMEGDPFALIEGLTIAAYAVGAEHGYIYLRDEYPVARELLTDAIELARFHGYLGPDLLGSGFSFDVEIVRGAGAYICGEETAIFNSIEGFRGEPRSKPPFPVESGLFDRPTLVNNVETLVNVPLIIEQGASFLETKLFCVSGAVERPGVLEVRSGASISDLIDLAGGVANGRTARAALLGGASGRFIEPAAFDEPLGSGSGALMIVDDLTPLEPLVHRIAEFFRHESCGRCVPCRVGTERQLEIVDRLTHATGRPDDVSLLRDVGTAMRDASICGLGQTAWNAIESAIDRLGVWR